MPPSITSSWSRAGRCAGVGIVQPNQRGRKVVPIRKVTRENRADRDGPACGAHPVGWLIGEGDGVSDTDLIRRASSGDAEAAGLLWQEHRRWVAAVVLAHKPREADLEDLLQEVALTVVQKLNQLTEPEAFKGWLRAVAVNTARATGRKQTRRKGLLRLVRSEPDQTADAKAGHDYVDPAGVERAERSKKLIELVSELPEAYRECVLLRCVRGMSHAQISAVTGLPETTVETRIARGRRKLKELAQGGSTAEAPKVVSS